MFQIPPYHQGPWAKRLAEQYGEMYASHTRTRFYHISVDNH
jgi:hypothetical protein